MRPDAEDENCDQDRIQNRVVQAFKPGSWASTKYTQEDTGILPSVPHPKNPYPPLNSHEK